MPLIVGASGKKLSKRRDPVSVQHFRGRGYLPDAMRNWLVRLGWSHGDQEIFSRDEIAHCSTSTAWAARAPRPTPKARLAQPALHPELPRDVLVDLALPFLDAELGHPR